jgi:serine/threonine protein kinase
MAFSTRRGFLRSTWRQSMALCSLAPCSETFLVLHAIGSGGMGVVYAAQQDRPRRTVAIKVLRRGFVTPKS